MYLPQWGAKGVVVANDSQVDAVREVETFGSGIWHMLTSLMSVCIIHSISSKLGRTVALRRSLESKTRYDVLQYSHNRSSSDMRSMPLQCMAWVHFGHL